MKHFIKKTIKGALAFTLLLPTTSNPIIVPQFPDEFVKVPDAPKLARLSIGKTNVWGIADKKTYRCQIGAAGKKFELVTGEPKLTDISVGYDDEEKPWGIGPNDAPYEYNVAKNNWTKKSGKLIQISVGQTKLDYIWGVNADGNLYCWGQKLVGAGWKGYKRPKLPDNNTAPLKHVSCGYDKDLWAIRKFTGAVWRLNQKDKKWLVVKDLSSSRTLTLKQVDVGDKDHIVGIDLDSIAKIYDPDSTTWEIIGNDILYISINKDGEIWLITKNNEVYWSKQSNVKHIRDAIPKVTAAQTEAKKAAAEAKEVSDRANEEAKKRKTEKAQDFAKEVEKKAKKAQEESTKADKAYQDVMQAAKTLDVVAAEEAVDQAKTAAQKAAEAVLEAKAAIIEVIIQKKFLQKK